MTQEQTWTKELPTETGWYWRRSYRWKANNMYYVFTHANIVQCRRSSNYTHDKETVAEVSGEWYGPITEPPN